MTRLLRLPLAAVALLAVLSPLAAAPPGEGAAGPKAVKVVLVASGGFYKPGEHEYLGGCAVLKHLLAQTPGVEPVVSSEWPTDPATFAGAGAVLFFGNGGAANPLVKGGHAAEVQKLVEAGVGLVALHQMADFPKDFGERARAWLGGSYEPGYSKRAHWVDTYAKFPDHPVASGVTPFRLDDGWLYQLRFADGMKGVTPLLRASDPKRDPKKLGTAPDADVVSWAFERPGGGRSFTFTGAHLYGSFAEPGYRKLLTNGVLWAAGVELPKQGAKVELSPEKLKELLPPPPTKE